MKQATLNKEHQQFVVETAKAQFPKAAASVEIPMIITLPEA